LHKKGQYTRLISFFKTLSSEDRPMSKVIMIGCDLHDAWMRLKMAVGPGKAVSKSFATADALGMIAWIKGLAAQHGAARIVFAYEASGQGFGLYDVLTDAGI